MYKDDEESWGLKVEKLIASKEGESELNAKQAIEFREWMMKRIFIGRAWDNQMWIYLYKVWKKINDPKRNDDHVLLVAGDEGTGKSTLAQLLNLTVNPGFNLDYFPGDAIQIDEGERLLLNTDHMTDEQKVVVKTFMQMRHLNVLTTICIPNYWKLTSDIRDRRIDGLIWIWHKDEQKRRASYRFLNMRKSNERVKQCFIDAKKKGILNPMRVRVPNGLFWDGNCQEKWPKFSYDEYYHKVKFNDWQNWLKEAGTRLNKKSAALFVSLAEATKALGLGRESLVRKIKSGELRGKKMGEKWMIERYSFEKYKKL